MTQVTEAPTTITLTEAQTMVSEAFKGCLAAMEECRARVRKLEGDITTLEELLPIKRAELVRARDDYAITHGLLREHFSLYRDVMDLTPDTPRPVDVDVDLS